MTLWRTRRLWMTRMYVIACLGLVPAFALLAWSVGDGPTVLATFGSTLPIPSIDLSGAYFIAPVLGFYIGILQVFRLAYDLREQAIFGDAEAMAPAKVTAASERFSLPISLIWQQTVRRRAWFAFGMLVSLALYGGLMAAIVASGLFDFPNSLQGPDFWALGGCALRLLAAMIPLAFLRELARGPAGVVADTLGITAWRGRSAHGAISWSDARLLEVKAGRSTSVLSYTLYARDGRSLRWVTYGAGPGFRHGHLLVDSAVNDGEQRAAAICVLAEAHAGLSARTLSSALAVRTSNLAADGNLLLSADSFAGWASSGYLTAFVAVTAGVGVSTLLERSALAPALLLVCAATLTLASLWSLGDIIAQALPKPRRLSRAERPAWSAEPTLASAPAARLRQTRFRWRNWPLATRAALLLVGSVAGLAAITAALVNGTSGESAELTAGSVVWLALTLLFAVMRLLGQLSRQRTRLDADMDGIRDLTTRGSRSIPWANIVSLRFTWSKRMGFRYLATTTSGAELTWASQSRFWRDDQPDATSFPAAPQLDGDTFAAYVAAHTGLTPAQTLNA